MRNNAAALKQLRKAQTELVNNDPLQVTVERITTTVDDGIGGTVEAPFGTPAAVSLKVRILHEKKGPDRESDSPNGLSSNLGRMIMSDYKNEILQGDIVPYNGINYKIGKRDILDKFGGVYGYQAPLTEANNG